MSLLATLPAADSYRRTGDGALPSAFAVSEMATASFAAVGHEMARLMQALNLSSATPEIKVDHRLASLWFGYSFKPDGWEMPSLWDAVAGDYKASDGWIRLHTNLPRHRAAALKVLGTPPDREAVATAVKSWSIADLETAVVAEGGVAAAMRSRTEWLEHPQGRAVSRDPLIGWQGPRYVKLRDRPQATAERPLAGLRVLDLTRVLAGPVSTRTLAGFGAEVLRIDPPDWDEPGVIPDISLGKHCAYLDLKSDDGLELLQELLSQADVFVHGYRPGALEALGLTRAKRDELAPNRIEVTLDAYGWQGPWSSRRGFDSLVQMSAGIAHTGMGWAQADKPTPLPVQALDHATGYLMAAAVLSALSEAAAGNSIMHAHLSLARTAELLAVLGKDDAEAAPISPTTADYNTDPEPSGWGPGQRLKPALQVGGASMRWDLPASKLGTSKPVWPFTA
ncbi:MULTISPECIES: CoA transferase [unclassified Ruegeria]|uniref:CoA transferase n=1 Tax=unclassified Ruegeria TaxID=2625375 RepID=UPI0014878359|nr:MULTISPECIES: CoA transferase [unclassified Ruegeria]NOD77233.1 acyl-CoA transferase [Ruegeria sp. HKCCD4332]NOD89704.1 acyl-CoA transferase [Ruegeria sp. HKCCD4318]NOE14027.1 acyl-CoA transferase [Ruegeria sp. HKCCD4318-2]NOG08036.1 acyl-CoA transferase [Ruegeria sp. HKCCD4315]